MAASTVPRFDLVGIVRATVIAVSGSIAVAIGIRCSATADAGCDLVGVVRAVVIAVGSTVAVVVGIRRSATADAGCDLVGVVRTAIVTVCCAVAVGIGIGYAAAADAWGGLVRITWATVGAIRGSVQVRIKIFNRNGEGAFRGMGVRIDNSVCDIGATYRKKTSTFRARDAYQGAAGAVL